VWLNVLCVAAFSFCCVFLLPPLKQRDGCGGGWLCGIRGVLWDGVHMTLGNTVPLARTFSKCAATDKAFETPPSHSSCFFFCWVAKKLLFSKRSVVKRGAGAGLGVVFAANKQQGGAEKGGGGVGGGEPQHPQWKWKKSVCILHSIDVWGCWRRTVGRRTFLPHQEPPPSTPNHPTRISRPATECSFQLCTLGVARVEGKAQGVRASSELK